MTKSDRVHEKVDRNAAVIARRAEGLTLDAIGLEFDISRGRGGYARFTLTDKRGRRAWTNPFWF